MYTLSQECESVYALVHQLQGKYFEFSKFSSQGHAYIREASAPIFGLLVRIIYIYNCAKNDPIPMRQSYPEHIGCSGASRALVGFPDEYEPEQTPWEFRLILVSLNPCRIST